MKELQIDILPWQEDHVQFNKTYVSNPYEIHKKDKNLQLGNSKSFQHKKQGNYELLQFGDSNFVRNNHSNLKEYSYYKNSNNYQALVNEDKDNFVPIKANNPQTISYLYKRHNIHTSHMSYIDNTIENNIYRRKTVSQKKSRTSSASEITNSPHKSRLSNNNSHLLQQNTTRDNHQFDFYLTKQENLYKGYHLQKVLKIKERLRQKLRRTSQKREIDRQYYINKGRQPSKELQKSQKKQSNVEKWKKKKMRSASLSAKGTRVKAERELSVLGGSIYK